MTQILNLDNFSSLNVVADTALNGDTAAGVNSLPVLSNSGFAAGTVLIGDPGSTKAELVTITAPTPGTALPISGVTLFAHNNGDGIYMLFGNKLKIYTATDQFGTGQQPDDSHFSLLDTISIDGSKASTAYTDAVSPVGVWYKYTFFNQTSGGETDLSDSRAYQSGQSHYVSIDQVRRAAGLQDARNVSDDIIAEKRDAAEREVNGALLPVYQFPLPQPTNPIIQQIAMNIAAGELKNEMYQGISESLADAGKQKADQARHGGGSHTSLDELVTRAVVLYDAAFNEQTVDEGHGFGGWPDDTTSSTPLSDSNGRPTGGDLGPHFSADQVY